VTDWEKRARELAENCHESSAWCAEQAKRILQLGREMADARAEEIAASIDNKDIYANEDDRAQLLMAAAIARSTISEAAMDRLEDKLDDAVDKEEQEINPWTQPMRATWPREESGPKTATEVSMELEEERRQARLRKAEADIRADEREKLLLKLCDLGHAVASERLRRILTPAPKTREQVLEDALIYIRDTEPEHYCDKDNPGKWSEVLDTAFSGQREHARRALEYKPDSK